MDLNCHPSFFPSARIPIRLSGLLMLFWFLGGAYGFSQTPEPGGVNGASEPVVNIWLRADDITSCTTDDCTPSSWAGTAGSPNGACVGVFYRTNRINFNPTVQAKANGQFVRFNNPNPNGHFSMFVVFKTTTTATSANWWDQPLIMGGDTSGNGNNDFALTMNGGMLKWNRRENQDSSSCNSGTPHLNDGYPYIAYVGRRQFGGGADQGVMHINGTLKSTGPFREGNLNSLTRLRLFRHPGGGGQLVGEIGEAIMYNDTLDATERQRVESYLAIKYGITLPKNYLLSDGTTTVYNRTTNPNYVYNIAGIGRDNLSGLDQRQSVSSNAQGIVAMAHGAFAATNEDNPTSFGSDKMFLMWADDGGTNCWSSEVKIPGAERQHLKLNRQWRYQHTNATGLGTTRIRLNVDDPELNLPELPANSDNVWYFYLDSNDDFYTGAQVYAMTMVSPGVWEVSITESDLTTNSYFTFGAKMNSSVLSPVYCVGEEIDFVGSFLGTPACASFMLAGPTDTIRLEAGASITPTTFITHHNGADECLDTLRWMTSVSGGPFNVFMYRDSVGTLCPLPSDSAQSMVPDVQQSTIQISSFLPIDAFLDGQTNDHMLYCLGDTNPVITNNAGSPATYTLISSPLLVPGQLIQSTGVQQVLLHTGTVGTHTVGVTATGTCGIDTLEIRIQTPQNSTFDVGGLMCVGLVDNSFIFPPSPMGGWFSVNPPLLTVHQDSGFRSSVGTPPGTYQITYGSSDSLCLVPSVDVVQVLAQDRMVFSYPNATYCTNGVDPSPSITQYPVQAGGFMMSRAWNGGSITVNPVTGVLDLSSVAATDTFTIMYNMTGTNCVSDDTTVVIVRRPSVISMQYPQDTICDNATVPLAPSVPAGFTNFTWTHSPLVIVNPTTGAITGNGSVAGGPYSIGFSADSSGCTSTAFDTVVIFGVNNVSVGYLASDYCIGQPNPLPLFTTGLSGGTFTSTPAGLDFANAITGEVDLQSSNIGVYSIYYHLPNNLCADSVLVTANFEVSSIPNANFFVDSLVCFRNGSVQITPVSPNTGGYRIYDGSTVVIPNHSTDILPFTGLQENTTYMIRKILANPSNTVCRDTAFDFFTILELEDATINFLDKNVCKTDEVIDIQIAGDGGGVFSMDTIHNPQTVVDPLNGRVDLVLSDSGSHIVIYTTQGPCPETDQDTLEILDGYLADFSFRVSEACETLDSLKTDTVYTTDPLFSRFYCLDSNRLAFDPVLGHVFPNQSIILGQDAFTIIHVTGGPGLCSDTSSARIFITAYDSSLAINYGQGPFCSGDGVLVPQITSAQLGNFEFNQPVGITYADTSLLGVIDPLYCIAGTYLIRIEINGVCGEQASQSITIIESDDADFDYGTTTFCNTDTIITPTVVTSPGSFAWTPYISTDVLGMVSTTTGGIDVSASSDGTYRITYTTQGSCPSTLSKDITINEPPSIAEVRILPDNSICEGETVTMEVSGSGGSFYWYRGQSMDHIGSGAVLVRNDFENGDTVSVVLLSASTGCSDTLRVALEVLVPPVAMLIDTPGLLTGVAPFELNLGVSQDQSWIAWSAVATGGVLAQDTGRTDTLLLNDVASVTNTISLPSDYDPASVWFYYRAVKNGCIGPRDSVFFTINPDTNNIFIPEVMTPNGDSKNDIWEIRYETDVTPSAYYIEVYNRSGGKEKTLARLDEVWDGGTLPDGVYWWILKRSDGTLEQSGGLTIRRR